MMHLVIQRLNCFQKSLGVCIIALNESRKLNFANEFPINFRYFQICFIRTKPRFISYECTINPEQSWRISVQIGSFIRTAYSDQRPCRQKHWIRGIFIGGIGFHPVINKVPTCPMIEYSWRSSCLFWIACIFVISSFVLHSICRSQRIIRFLVSDVWILARSLKTGIMKVFSENFSLFVRTHELRRVLSSLPANIFIDVPLSSTGLCVRLCFVWLRSWYVLCSVYSQIILKPILRRQC